MSRIVPIEDLDVCEVCGEQPAYDVMGIYTICSHCLDTTDYSDGTGYNGDSGNIYF